MGKYKIGIVGGAGYTAGELVRLLVHHPEADLKWVHSESQAGLPVTSVHQGLVGDTDLIFTDTVDLDSIDVLFLCMGHGKSWDFWRSHKMPESLKVVDLAQDFRDESCGYVYGLPEINRERIKLTRKVANPGCFATAIQLAVLPLAKAGMLNSEINVTAITGSTGAGVKPAATTHFSWRNNNVSVYKAFKHQHMQEINVSISEFQPDYMSTLNFLPVRGDFARGIFAPVYVKCSLSQEEAQALYRDFYKDAAFTFVTDLPIDLKQVVNTNKCLMRVQKIGSQLLIECVIDNLLKGASGQAVQNMNLMLGLDEKAGLRLKASAF